MFESLLKYKWNTIFGLRRSVSFFMNIQFGIKNISIQISNVCFSFIVKNRGLTSLEKYMDLTGFHNESLRL